MMIDLAKAKRRWTKKKLYVVHLEILCEIQSVGMGRHDANLECIWTVLRWGWFRAPPSEVPFKNLKGSSGKVWGGEGLKA